MMTFTIVAIAGDNGSTFAIGRFGSREAAGQVADKWQERDNPDLDPDGMHYSATRIQTVTEWRSAAR